MIAFVVAALAAPTQAPFEIAAATPTRHEGLFHRDVPWHRLLPATDDEALILVEVSLRFPWSEALGAVPIKDEEIALVVGEARHPVIAMAEAGRVYKSANRRFSRPYRWEEGSDPSVIEVVFAVPGAAREATLEIAGASAPLALPGEASQVADPLSVGAFEIRYATWIDKAPTKGVLEGVQVRDEIVAPCELLSIGVAVRAIEGPSRSSFGLSDRLVLRSGLFAVSGARVGLVPPLEQRVSAEWPDREADISIFPGKERTLELLFCLPEREPLDVLYRGVVVGPIPQPEPSAPAPEPAPKTGVCSAAGGTPAVLPLLFAFAVARRRSAGTNAR